jgi:hypothetical protein
MRLALQILGALSECLPRQNGAQALSPEALEFMAEGLVNLPADDLRRGAGLARDTCKFFPTVAELRALSGAVSVKPEDAHRAEELAAWEQVQRWVKRHRDKLRCVQTGHLGWPLPEQHIEPLPARANDALRRVGGPDAIQSAWGSDSETWLQKSFCEAYRLSDAIGDAQLALGAASDMTGELAVGMGMERMLKEAR